MLGRKRYSVEIPSTMKTKAECYTCKSFADIQWLIRRKIREGMSLSVIYINNCQTPVSELY